MTEVILRPGAGGLEPMSAPATPWLWLQRKTARSDVSGAGREDLIKREKCLHVCVLRRVIQQTVMEVERVEIGMLKSARKSIYIGSSNR